MTPGKSYLTSDEIRPLAKRSDAMGIWLVLHCWLVIGWFDCSVCRLAKPLDLWFGS